MASTQSLADRPELWERAKEIFGIVAELVGEERDASLTRLCGSNFDLSRAVGALLRAHGEAGEFLEPPRVDISALLSSVPDDRADSLLGTRVDRYELRELLGEGGFGTVYVAEQLEPVRRMVALKLIKPGMDTRQVIARFEAERQALALMTHENIARVLDGGQTSAQRPYFVMELVRGEPITRFCAGRQLPVAARLELLLPVCRAVHHAHQKGLIHRDLKPSNVLVESQDDRAVPKVIDFGVAKAIGGAAGEHTIWTVAQQMVGTPAYMSPEQLDGNADVDVRSDVYALGVLLYEMLVGVTPIDASRLSKLGLADLQRLVREFDPPRPSTRLLERSVAEGAAAIMTYAGERDSLRRTLRGDIDWIVMKCLEKDRSRRYGSASDLAADIERYLRNEPVSAGPPTAAYRLRKFAARHRGLLVAVALVALTLIGGLAASLVGFVAAGRARDEAQRNRLLADRRADESRAAAQRADGLSRFLQEILSYADPRQSGRQEMTLRDALNRAVERMDRGALRDQPRTEAAARLTIGRALREQADYAAAQAQLDAALRMTRELYGDADVALADALQESATLKKALSDRSGAICQLEEAVQISRARRSADDPKMVTLLSDLAVALSDDKRNGEAEKLLREALAVARRADYADEVSRAEVLNNLAGVLFAGQRTDEAEPLYREAISINRRLLGEASPTLATNLDNLAQLEVAKGDLVAAEAAYREALSIRRRVFSGDHPDVATSLHNYATLLFQKQDLTGCEDALREALDMFRRVHGATHPDTQVVIDSLSTVLAMRQKIDECERLMLDNFAAIEHDAAVAESRKAAVASRIAELYAALQRSDDAERWSQVSRRFSPQPP